MTDDSNATPQEVARMLTSVANNWTKKDLRLAIEHELQNAKDRCDALVAERDRLRQALEEARLQLEYLHSRWPTGSSEQALARIREVLGDG